MTRRVILSTAAALCGLVLAWPGSARADIIFTNLGPGSSYDITQGNPIGNGQDGSGNNYAQGVSFIASANFNVTEVQVALSGLDAGGTNADTLIGSLTADNGDQPGAVIASVTIDPGSTGPLGTDNPLLFAMGSVPITAGNRYWITISDPTGTGSVAWNLNNTGDTNDEAVSGDGGATWFSPSGLTPGAFEVDGTPQQVVAPEPSSLALLGTGALALVGRRLRRLGSRNQKRGAEQQLHRRPQVETLEDRNLLATWTPLAHLSPDFAGTMTLMTNGQVLVQGYSPGSNFMLLTPDASGSYINGTWSNAASMSTPRLYYSSNVLSNGNLFVLGGEYSGNGLPQNSSNTGEIYNPVTNTWGPLITNFPQATYGDEPSMLLPNGTSVLVSGGDTQLGFNYIYNSLNGTFTGPIPKVYENFDSNDEEGWVKLQNGNVLTYDLFTSVLNNGQYAEEFNTQTDTWSSISPSDGSANGFIPQLSSQALGFELGPVMRLQDGRVLVLGANDNTALYNPATNTWSAGPQIMGTLNGQPAAFGADDAPAAELPNGHVIFAADAGPTLGTFSPPTELFDFNPTTNTITQLTPALNDPNFPSEPSYPLRMLELPNGQLLLNDSSRELYVFTPDGSAPLALKPVVNSVTFNAGTFTLTGKQLNGQSAGSMYGDDVESDENYPIVSLKNTTSGQLFYARTSNWSSTGVATGSTPETVNFTLPAGMTAGNYSLVESGAGIQSFPLLINISGSEIGGLSAVQQSAALTSGSHSTPGFSSITARESANPNLVGVSLALTSRSGVLSAPAATHGNLTAHTDMAVAGFGLSHETGLLQNVASDVATAPQSRSTGAGKDVMDSLFADYFINPL